MTKIKNSLVLILALQAGVLLLWLISKAVFVSFEVALLSGALITMGSLYAYRNMIRSRVEHTEIDDSKDVIDELEDPYDLYEEEREEEITDIKQMIKEEKARQKQQIVHNTVKNGAAWVSMYRLLPYAFLILGFLGLQNNHSLQLIPYMVGLGVGIITGYVLARKWFL
ncbi:MAG: hypothetical protein PHW18_08525 [Sulfuricurvum sp.]|uniref:hypothetical protein n=1 Tax=Sulfuricurvum sp. TaxID=2025608 RepID=UPI00260716D2|nr:hypothetical protein [Sulfuricurvum sp.]MDD2829601.1 hypothetical protein [Sulfuricurvum sp.]MDD4950533.1 hypothetical protein [Sulfuricurvum sp.]